MQPRRPPVPASGNESSAHGVGPVATDGNDDEATAATNGRTHRLCEYGTYPRYTGPANPTQAQANDAANLTCTANQG
jgi:feruloyl esterase